MFSAACRGFEFWHVIRFIKGRWKLSAKCSRFVQTCRYGWRGGLRYRHWAGKPRNEKGLGSSIIHSCIPSLTSAQRICSYEFEAMVSYLGEMSSDLIRSLHHTIEHSYLYNKPSLTIVYCGMKLPLIGNEGTRSKNQERILKAGRQQWTRIVEIPTKIKAKPTIGEEQERNKAKPLKRLEPLIAAPSSARK